MLLHASCVALNARAVLITGAPGAGKSDLALRLMDDGAELIADDQTQLSVERNALIASAPPSIAGLIEVRHVGLLRAPFLRAAPVALYIELATADEALERLPEKQSAELLGRSIPKLRLPGFAASTPAKIRAALCYPNVTDAV